VVLFRLQSRVRLYFTVVARRCRQARIAKRLSVRYTVSNDGIEKTFMNLSKVAYYTRVAARYIEEPSQLRMRRPYFLPEIYMALGKPWAQSLSIHTILDIGANIGNFAYTVRPLFPTAMIYSFEPLPDQFAELQRNMAGVERFCAFNLGIGEQNIELMIHRSQHAPSSSFLTMDDLHRRSFPTSAPVTEEVPVKVVQLDSLQGKMDLAAPLLAKIDVQGYELHVLRGGEQTLRQAKVLIIETSFRSLYEGGPLFADVFEIVTSWGFTYQGSVDTLEDPTSGILLQEDSLFVQQ